MREVPSKLSFALDDEALKPGQVRGIDFKDVTAFLRRNAIWTGAWLLAMLSIAFVYIATTKPTFLATAQVIIDPKRPQISSQMTDYGIMQVTLDSSQLESQIQILRSERISRPVITDLNLAADPEFDGAGSFSPVGYIKGLFSGPASPNDSKLTKIFTAFNDRMNVRRLGQSYVLEVSFSSTDPDKSARIANSVVASYIRDQLSSRAESAARGEWLQGRLTDLKAEIDAASRAVRTGDLQATVFPSSDSKVITSATAPLGKSAPQIGLVLIFSTCLGLLLGVGTAGLRQRFDNTVRNSDQIEALGVECLSVLPRLSSRAEPATRLFAVRDEPSGFFADQLRYVKTAIDLARNHRPIKVIGVTGPHEGLGTTTIAANLAELFAQAGQSTLLVDANLRCCDLTRLVASEQSVGLVDVLCGRAPLAAALVELSPKLAVLPASLQTTVPNSNDIVGSASMKALLAKAGETYGCVLIDIPGFKDIPDARAMMPSLDALIIVARSGVTEAADLGNLLNTTGVMRKTLGVIVNRSDLIRRPRAARV
ncbi:tyrosine-protein kinase domain-containing protein [Alsobacter metallidurans]|nr:tyrosine-protein kinase domain-containing protein [Alsobacter metallidurans]